MSDDERLTPTELKMLSLTLEVWEEGALVAPQPFSIATLGKLLAAAARDLDRNAKTDLVVTDMRVNHPDRKGFSVYPEDLSPQPKSNKSAGGPPWRLAINDQSGHVVLTLGLTLRHAETGLAQGAALYSTADEPTHRFTLDELKAANTDAPIDEGDLEELRQLSVGQSLTLGGGAAAETIIWRIA